ncbi:MAG TPA: hypothetical protein VEW48_21885 [Thermoanaerobaculia bacterium]|nr:hypothetical protein [Thermoanaerobaculia bacterium]
MGITTRSVQVFFENRTEATLFRSDFNFDADEWQAPPVQIDPGTTGQWGCDNASIPFFGVEGNAQFVVVMNGANVGHVFLDWSNPFAGADTFKIRVDFNGTSDSDSGSNHIDETYVRFVLDGVPGAFTVGCFPEGTVELGQTTGGGLIVNTVMSWAATFIEADDAHGVIAGLAEDDFLASHAGMLASGLTITQITSQETAGQRRWSAVYRSGFETHLERKLTTDAFVAEFGNHYGKDCLIDFSTYEESGDRFWTGVWQLGRSDDHVFLWGYPPDDFTAKTQEIFDAGAPLSIAKPYFSGDQLLWAGLCHPAPVGSYFERDMSLARFLQVWEEQYPTSCLISLEAYDVGGQTLWSGIWHDGLQGNSLSYACADTVLIDDFYAWHDAGLRLAYLTVYQDLGD